MKQFSETISKTFNLFLTLIIRDNLMYILSLMNLFTKMQFNINIRLKIGSKGFGLVAAQVIIEAYSRMMKSDALHPLYTHTHKRAGVRACGRASVRACERGQK